MPASSLSISILISDSGYSESSIISFENYVKKLFLMKLMTISKSEGES